VDFSLESIAPLIGRSANDVLLLEFFGEELGRIERDEYYGALQYKKNGVDVVFQEACLVDGAREDRELILIAFHLHAEGHEEFSQYRFSLPFDVNFGANWGDLISGFDVVNSGGGIYSKALGGWIGRWFVVRSDNFDVHLQFDSKDCLVMVTLMLAN